MKLYLSISIGIIFNYFIFSQRTDTLQEFVQDTLISYIPLTPIEKTDSIINNFKKDPVLKNAQWGFVVYNPKTKKVIVSKDEGQAFIPASTTKIITTETALNLVGENFKWKTELDFSGEIDSLGRLNGNLYIASNNDPTLGYSQLGALTKNQFFSELHQTLSQNGVKEIMGNIIAESVVFKSDFPLPKDVFKFDQGNYYSIPNKIALNTNIIDLNPQDSQGLFDSNKSVITSLTTPKIEQQSYINLENPPLNLAKEFKNYLTSKKMKVTGFGVSQDYSTINISTTRTKLYVLESPSLKDVIHFVNKTSSNYFAENLLKLVGYYVGRNSSKEIGIENVMNHLNKEKFDTSLLNYADGSGLSRNNYVTPISQVKYLADIMKKPYFNTFYDSLPSAGESGTLKNMFLNSIATGRIHAKTGTLSNVKALTGYVDTISGDRLCFSLLVNNFQPTQINTVKKRMQTLLESVVNY